MLCPEVIMLQQASIPFLVVGFVLVFLRFLSEVKLTVQSINVRRGGMPAPTWVVWEDTSDAAYTSAASIQGTGQDASVEGVESEERSPSLATV